jgi:hypothetical protein
MNTRSHSLRLVNLNNQGTSGLMRLQSHFTELKYGLISGAQGREDNTLSWNIGGQRQWTTNLTADTWYNLYVSSLSRRSLPNITTSAYDIDFDGKKCGLYQSTGASPLVQVVAPKSCSASTNSADWHLGVLRLPNGGTSGAAADFFWSRVFVEQAPVTTAVAGPFAGAYA